MAVQSVFSVVKASQAGDGSACPAAKWAIAIQALPLRQVPVFRETDSMKKISSFALGVALALGTAGGAAIVAAPAIAKEKAPTY